MLLNSLRSEESEQIGQLIAPLRKAHSIPSDVKDYWLDQFLTLALNILILSIFYISMDLSTNYFAHFSGC